MDVRLLAARPRDGDPPELVQISAHLRLLSSTPSDTELVPSFFRTSAARLPRSTLQRAPCCLRGHGPWNTVVLCPGIPGGRRRALRDSSATAAEVLGGFPEPRPDDDNLRASIRAMRAADGLLLGVLDDDPTGSQAVHGVEVVTVLEEEAYGAALAGPAATCFVLTNTRSMEEAAAARPMFWPRGACVAVAERRGTRLQLVSRSDSTLRGHVMAEVTALDSVCRESAGRGYDGVLLVPAFLEAGRLTAGDIHWARVGGRLVPVGETEFAQDAAFGYSASDLRDFLAEKSGGTIRRDEVGSIGLADIRLGGPQRVGELLAGVRGGSWVVVNAMNIRPGGSRRRGADGRARGRVVSLPHRPLLRARAGRHGPAGPAPRRGHLARGTAPAGRPRPGGGGVARRPDQPPAGGAPRPGRHYRLRAGRPGSRRRRRRGDPDGAAGGRRAARCGCAALHQPCRGHEPDGAGSLAIARTVSAALSQTVRGALAARPGWVVAKGGITSHDVARHGLGIRRAEVAGQLFPGVISLLRPLDAAAEAIGMPYVVFAGNVGDDGTLADVVAILNGEREER